MKRVVLDTNITIAALFVEKKSKISVIAADPTDNIFLGCAVNVGWVERSETQQIP